MIPGATSYRIVPLLISSALCSYATPSFCSEWSGYIALEDRYFTSSPLQVNDSQHSNYLSMSAEIEYYTNWDNRDQSLTITPFIRIDQYDNNRTHGDFRELLWLMVFDGWQVKAGVSKVFWGVTESQHLVDIINQTDNIENIDGEDKLGQPMISASFEQDWGLVDLFILPYFRERNFQDIEGRPRSYPTVSDSDAIYESSDRQNHMDYAARIFSYLDDLELGLSYFRGTSREPTFIFDSTIGRLLPFYRQIEQFGLDTQYTTAEWLWKAEIIKRNWSAKDYLALTAGFEYTFVGIMDSSADLGLVIEYLYDDRHEATSGIFQNDLMAGLRYTLNDAHSTEALFGLIVDMDYDEVLINLEASRRLSQHWSLNLEARGFANISENSRAFQVRKDDFIQIEASYYF